MTKKEFKKRIRQIDFDRYSCWEILDLFGDNAWDIYTREFKLCRVACWAGVFLWLRGEATEENEYDLRQLLVGMFEEFCIREKFYLDFEGKK